MRLRAFIALFLLLASPLSAAGPEITDLANEGFLLACGETRVLIDAFVPEPYLTYGAVPGETWQQMIDREPPFDRVALALVSHVHRDHVQPDAAVRFLSAHPETRLITSPEVVAKLRAVEGFAAIAERIEAVLPEPGETVLHVGDAAVRTESFPAYELAERGIDLALLPFGSIWTSRAASWRRASMPDATPPATFRQARSRGGANRWGSIPREYGSSASREKPRTRDLMRSNP